MFIKGIYICRVQICLSDRYLSWVFVRVLFYLIFMSSIACVIQTYTLATTNCVFTSLPKLYSTIHTAFTNISYHSY